MSDLDEAKAFYALKAAIPVADRSLPEQYGVVLLSALTEAEQ